MRYLNTEGVLVNRVREPKLNSLISGCKNIDYYRDRIEILSKFRICPIDTTRTGVQNCKI